VETNREVFSLEYGPLGLLWHEGIRWRDDVFWLVEADPIRVWDLVDGTLLWTAPVAPRFPSRSTTGFTHNAWVGSDRHEKDARVVYPFVALMAGRYEVVIARADDQGVELTRRLRGRRVEKSRFASSGVTPARILH
jgi:hypothetical protein